MIATVRLTIDLEVKTKRRFWFDKKNYAKATFAGDLEVGDLKNGDILQLKVYNCFPTEFEVRSLRKNPNPDSKEIKGELILYHRASSVYLDRGIKYFSIAESARRLRTTIADNLKQYGLLIQEEKCGIGDKPSYVTLPPSISSTSYLNTTLQVRF